MMSHDFKSNFSSWQTKKSPRLQNNSIQPLWSINHFWLVELLNRKHQMPSSEPVKDTHTLHWCIGAEGAKNTNPPIIFKPLVPGMQNIKILQFITT